MVAVDVLCQVCIVLGHARMWKVWDAAQGDKDHRVPSSITVRVMLAVHNLGLRNRLEAETNPIQQGSIGVSGIDAELYVFEILGSGSGSNTSEHDTDGCDPRIKAGKQAAEMRGSRPSASRSLALLPPSLPRISNT